MCGIIGIIGNDEATPKLLEGLRRLEYRGYDSAGIAVMDGQAAIHRRRAEGKISALDEVLRADPLSGKTGIGHTRWATHGVPSTNNAHPHASKDVTVVHNGIIENFQQLRAELEGRGHVFETDTDTEVIPHIISDFLARGAEPLDAVQRALAKLEGAYALGIIFEGRDNMMIAARHGSPLAVGYGDGEMYIGSDAIALTSLASRICYLEEGDVAVLSRDDAQIYDRSGTHVQRDTVQAAFSGISIGKENYRHFMQKEIFEQPSVLADLIGAYYSPVAGNIELPPLPFNLADVSRVTIIACGTSYYAASVAKYWMEQYAHVPTDIDIASEYRYRGAVMGDTRGGVPLAVFISQSGETADTLAATRYAKAQGQRVVAVVNVPQSTLAREADIVLPIYSGPEISVASTKAFTCQLATLAFFTLALARSCGALDRQELSDCCNALVELPARMAHALEADDDIRKIAAKLAVAHDIIYIGRGTSYPIALEGALKLKELSYIHAEATAAGELKHGIIALIDEDVPVICIAPRDDLFDKTTSNIREIAARGGKLVVLSDAQGIKTFEDVSSANVEVEAAHKLITPILYAIPVQLLAYHVAVLKGTDVDQPRNLAKSVTVE